MHLNTLYLDFLAHLPPSAERAEFLQLLQSWTKLHLRHWSSDTREAFGLDELVSLDLSRFPIDQSALDPDEEIRQLRSLKPGSKDSFAMFLRDRLWGGITVETDITCPNCEGPALKILEDTEHDEILLVCDQCAWVQTPQGAHVEPRGKVGTLQPVTVARLQRYRETGR